MQMWHLQVTEETLFLPRALAASSGSGGAAGPAVTDRAGELLMR